LNDARKAFETAAVNMTAVAESTYPEAVDEAVELIVTAFKNGSKLLVFGNGGSAADAQHICAELVGRFAKRRAGWPAIALTSNQAVLTAWSNDEGFDSVFERQIQALARAGDVAWAISTSGNSPNIVKALRKARESGVRTIGLTGSGGGLARPWCDVLLAVPLTETPEIQEVHVVTYHSICRQVEARMTDVRDV